MVGQHRTGTLLARLAPEITAKGPRHSCDVGSLSQECPLPNAHTRIRHSVGRSPWDQLIGLIRSSDAPR